MVPSLHGLGGTLHSVAHSAVSSFGFASVCPRHVRDDRFTRPPMLVAQRQEQGKKARTQNAFEVTNDAVFTNRSLRATSSAPVAWSCTSIGGGGAPVPPLVLLHA
eukprot:4558340-Amphidinium_carterae.1